MKYYCDHCGRRVEPYSDDDDAPILCDDCMNEMDMGNEP
jgi:DNA-directed RNA polymerase subunit RPC12/RpoP